MPFGLDVKSLIVGILLAWFVIPWLQALVVRNKPSSAAV